MTYPASIQFLYDLQLFGAKFGLENTRKLAGLAGDPQGKLRFIHVAGTNGKGSVCAFLESIYRASGLRVGLYTSPHLVWFRERIQVNREPISEPDVARLVEGMSRWLTQFPRDHHPTFFEVVTVMALQYFAEKKCDLVIWETGMGGRLDATNIVTPLASVITNVQFDHQQWLGDTLAKIAFEKAGIIKPQVPVLTAVNEPEALQVIRKRAEELSASWVQVPGTCFAKTRSYNSGAPILEELRAGLLGPHQQANAALALETVRILQPLLPVSKEVMQHGLSSVSWPGRFQIVERPNQTLILDGAHNPDGMRALRMALQEKYPGQKPAFIFGALADKNVAEMCRILGEQASRIILCPVRSKRSIEVADAASIFLQQVPNIPWATAGGLKDALTLSDQEPLMVICGSLYLIGEALEQLGISTLSSPGEHVLNEWQRTG